MMGIFRKKNLDGVRNARLFNLERDIEQAENTLFEHQDASEVADLMARVIKRDISDIEHQARKEMAGKTDEEKEEIKAETAAAVNDLQKTYDVMMDLASLIRKNEKTYGLPVQL